MEFRTAKKSDVKDIVRLLADDELWCKWEKYAEPLPEAYYNAFSAIENQSGNQILLAIEGETVVGCLQLTIIPGLARLGMKRAQIEGVRVDKNYRVQKIGEALFRKAMKIAKSEGSGLVQLTTDKNRADAHRYYEKFGFTSSHEGMKLILH